ncbi:receptor-like protein EIX2 [Citrus sinensis]|uniref:receptor-like protein EIX2 n=1 Tax=Citrus sinensis TaxID=2711 RepID=UPI00227798F1|nr:receptor-like protein EIX2 [Citrus sinensis]
MKPNMSGVLVFALFLFEILAIATISISFCNGSSYHGGCLESERGALLRLKRDLKDPSNRLASWTGSGDCCAWTGVVCDNMTGHVLHLDLRNPFNYSKESEYDAIRGTALVGKINPSLLDLKHLSYLDLSFNDFQGDQIPRFVGSMGNLRYLNFSGTRIGGMIPQQLGNLSNLQFLDLSSNYLLYVDNILWLSGLSVLEHLDLRSVNLSKAFDWLMVANKLPSLVELRLSNCQLQFSPLATANFSSLTVLDLSHNQFDNSFIPSWVFGLSHLLFLDLGFNNFQGPIPGGLQNLTSLKHLGLDSNYFNSSIPNWLYRFIHLEYLSLRNNKLQGTIDSEALGNLTSISRLDLSLNTGPEGRIPRSMASLCNLKSINLRGVHLSQEISEILNIFSGCVSIELESLDLRSSSISGHLTDQLGQFKNLDNLDLANNSIVGPIPQSLGHLSNLRVLQIYNNKLNGTLSEIHFSNLTKLSWFRVGGNKLTLEVRHDWIPPFQLVALGFHNCYVGSRFPQWLHSQKHLQYLNLLNSGMSDLFPIRFLKSAFQLKFLDLGLNQFHGQITDLTKVTQLLFLSVHSNNMSGPLPLISSNLVYLDLSNNSFSGSVSHYLCYRINEPKSLIGLKLKDNSLQGEIPDCWMSYQNLEILELSNNKFTGKLPNSLGSLTSLIWLLLGKNRLSGTIPVSLKNCTALESLDVGENEFVGNIPTWTGERFSRMVVLILRSNNFHGPLPTRLCDLAFLQILDLADNNLFGTIPKCINNITGMVAANSFTRSSQQYLPLPLDGDVILTEKASVVSEGEAIEYDEILNLVKETDVSRNNLTKSIPLEMTNLKATQSLNFSHNSFTGRIPESIGAMRSLESIDFSVNQLSGEIPQSMSNLMSLNHLNLSNNKLTGKIPSSTQLQSFDASSFTGNDLCGAPLPKNCAENVSVSEDENGDEDEDEVDHWLYVSIALGFVVGFGCFIGPLIFNRRWRYNYYHFLNRLENIIVGVVRKCS